jgi:hypothetical protein
MTTPGLNSTDFNAMFPEFSTVSSALITTFINLVNNGYQFTQDAVTDPVILNIYYWLVAHLVATSTKKYTGNIAGPSGSYLPAADSAGLVSISYQQVQGLSADQSFMLSTRYGEVFWTFTKQQYVINFYLSPGCW